MSGTQIPRGSILQYSVETRILRVMSMLILFPAYTAYLSSEDTFGPDIPPDTSLYPFWLYVGKRYMQCVQQPESTSDIILNIGVSTRY